MSFLDSLVGNTIQAVEQTATLGKRVAGDFNDNLNNALIRGEWQKGAKQAELDWLSKVGQDQDRRIAHQKAETLWDPKKGDPRSPENFPEFQKLAQAQLQNNDLDAVFGPIQTPEASPSPSAPSKTNLSPSRHSEKNTTPPQNKSFSGGSRGITIPSALPSALTPAKSAPPTVQYQNGKFLIGGEPSPELNPPRFQLRIKTKNVGGKSIPQVSYR